MKDPIQVSREKQQTIELQQRKEKKDIPKRGGLRYLRM